MATPDGTRCAGCQTLVPTTTGRGRPRKFCDACRPPKAKSYTPTPLRERTCEQCSVQFFAKRTTAKYCTNRCRNHAKDARTATEVVACKHCGDGFERLALGAKKRVQVYCCKHCMAVARSRRCADCTVRAVAPGTTRCDPCAAHSRWEREMWALVKDWLAPAVEPQPVRIVACAQCNTTFETRKADARWCSKTCKHRHHSYAGGIRRRAREKKPEGSEPVYRRRIAERDGWRCKLCGAKVKREAKVPHPLAPTLDHIIPLAEGGTHEPSNVQLAHFRCNVRKGIAARNEQLLLIG